jgi:8-oxo-dGTP pyrophosphatase MutT (NUDIX family)
MSPDETKLKPKSVPVAAPAATVLLLRDNPGLGDAPLEVFMVVRHHQIDFASGALVFPGGKLTKGDSEPKMRGLVKGGQDLSDYELALCIGSLRESFEECGVLLALDKDSGVMIGPDRIAQLAHYRPQLDKGEISMGDFLKTENLILEVDQLVRYSHWVTPDMMPKRFDTHFYLVTAPSDQIASHDGREMVDSVWISPTQALQDAEDKKRTVIFPTRMNLQMLAESKTVAEALAAAQAREIVTVLPVLEKRGDENFLCIPKDAGYGISEIPAGRMMS